MGGLLRLSAFVLVALMALAMAPSLGLAQHVSVDQPGVQVNEGEEVSFYIDVSEIYFFGYVSINCYVYPSTTATYGTDFTLAPASPIIYYYDYSYSLPVSNRINISAFEDGRYEPDNDTIAIRIDVEEWDFPGIFSQYTLWANYTLVDTTPAVRFDPASYTVNDTDHHVTLTLVRSGNLTGPLSVNYSTANGTAIDGRDYYGESDTVTFDAGDDSETIRVNLRNNHANSSTPVFFFVNLSDPVGGIVAGSNATVSINQNARAGVFSLHTGNATVVEMDGSIEFIVDRTVAGGHPSDGASVVFSTTDGTALAGRDYTTVLRTLVFAHDEMSKEVSVPIIDTPGYDGRRYFVAQLTTPGGNASINSSSSYYEVNILDDEPAPVVRFGDYDESVSEGSDVDIEITRSGQSNISGSVLFTVKSSTAPQGRFTCDPAPGTRITFSPGQMSRNVRVSVPYNPSLQEAHYVVFQLGDTIDMSIGASNTNVLTINNIPPIGPTVPSVQFPASAAFIDRGTNYSINIIRNSKEVDSEVTFEVAGGNAVAGTDYTISPAPGSTISFAVGEDTKAIQVSVPSTLSGDRTLSLGLVPRRNATLADPSTIALNLRNLGTITPTPTPAPPPIDQLPLLLQVSVAPDTITPGAEAIVNVTVTNGNSPVTTANVNVTCSRGELTPLSSQNANGKYFWRFKPNTPGACTLSITATATDYLPGTASATVQVVSAPVGALGLSMAVSPDPVPAGSDAHVTVTVTADGRPLPGAIVNIVGTGGSLDPPIGSTGPDGTFRTLFRAGTVDTYVLTIGATATGHPSTSGSYGINVVESAGRRLYCTLSTRPQSIGPGGTADVIVMVTDGSGVVEGAEVAISATRGSLEPANGTTGPDGRFTARLTAGDAGTYTLIAYATAPDSTPADAATLIDVSPGLIDLRLLLLGLLALAVAAAALYGAILLVGKWREVSLKVTPKAPFVQADGTSRLPVRVEAFNGFGKPKSMRSNARVDLEATAGKIGDVVIPAGKSFADAVLVSSREFGMVTVTARLGDQAFAAAPVEFRLENGSLAVSVSPSSLIADSKSSATITVRVRNAKGQYVTPLEDRAVELSTTLGDIIGSIAPLPAKAQSVSARILSPGSTGTATVTATMGNLKGIGRVEFKGLPTRPCPGCGQPVANSVTVCPWCEQDLRQAARAPAPEVGAR